MSGKITSYTLEDLSRMKGETDWDRLRAEGDFEGEDDEDWPKDIDWSTARIVMPQTKKAVSVRLDADVLAFFKSGGPGYQTRMNAVLRAYMEARKAG